MNSLESDRISRISLCSGYTKTPSGLILPGSWVRGLDAARAASEYSDGVPNRDKMGAAIFSGGRLLAVGFNLYKKASTRGVVMKRGREIILSIHAEESATSKLKYRDYSNNKLTIYIFRKNTKNELVTSKPCIKCQELLYTSGIKIARYINSTSHPEEIRF